ncbi:MAG: 50S ribosomal protein L10 [bacterium]|nr:50S ribosomal protein L10 [bacterium]
MPLNRSQKEKQISEVTDLVKDARMIVLADYKGMSVAKSMQFRRKVREGGGAFKVVKKTLAKISLERAGFPADMLTGYKDTLALAVHDSADSALAKLFLNTEKDYPELKVVGGVFERRGISKAEVMAIAKLPSRDEMLSMFLNVLLAPASGFVRTLNGPVSGFVTVLNKVATQ